MGVWVVVEWYEDVIVVCGGYYVVIDVGCIECVCECGCEVDGCEVGMYGECDLGGVE